MGACFIENVLLYPLVIWHLQNNSAPVARRYPDNPDTVVCPASFTGLYYNKGEGGQNFEQAV